MKKVAAPQPFGEILRKAGNQKRIGEYFQDAQVLEAIRACNRLYLHWNEFVYTQVPDGKDKELVWAMVKVTRSSTYRDCPLLDTGDERFMFRYSITDYMVQVLRELDMSLGGALRSEPLVPEEEKTTYLLSSLMEEAIASSRLEGAATTRTEAKEMLRAQRRPRTRDERMVTNNYRALLELPKLKGRKLTAQMLLQLHAAITKDTLARKEDEGRFRSTDDEGVVDSETNETVYVPPPSAQLPGLVDSLCAFANKREKDPFMHPVLKASALHFLVGYLRPFADGNGRTARAVFYWYLLSNDYWRASYASISRTIVRAPAQYARAYQYVETDQNDLTYFIHFMLKTLHLALVDLKAYVRKRGKEKREGYKFLTFGGINERQADALRRFETEPTRTMTIRQYQNIFGVVYQTARTDLLDLVGRGFLRKTTRGKTSLVFHRSQRFDEVLAGAHAGKEDR